MSEKKYENIYVLIAAAGCSRRMKQFKPLLPLHDMCILESTLKNFQDAGLHNIITVVGYRKQKMIPILKKAGVLIVENNAYDETDMLESIRLGLQSVPPRADAVFLCPADVALVSPFTVQELIAHHRAFPSSVLLPAYHGECGHPPLFTRPVMEALTHYKGDKGMRGVLEMFQDDTEILEVPDPEILEDADLPKDYERLKAAAKNRAVPSVRVCEDIWDYVKTPSRVRAHCRAVERTALKLAEAYEARHDSRSSSLIDVTVLSRAALLHDMLKTQPHHAKAAADMLELMGYCGVAGCVRYHKQLPTHFRDTVNETTLLYLADRLVIEDRSVSLAERFLEKKAGFTGNTEALECLERDRKTAEHLYELIRGEKP